MPSHEALSAGCTLTPFSVFILVTPFLPTIWRRRGKPLSIRSWRDRQVPHRDLSLGYLAEPTAKVLPLVFMVLPKMTVSTHSTTFP
jgi:hypothetical protein